MLFSTNYFGSIPYFQAIASFDRITIDVHENYKKQTWRNRTSILESNGPMYLSVPVIRPKGGRTPVGEVIISDVTKWRKDHWKAIESSYKHAPYFFYYGPQLKMLIENKEPSLYFFNKHILKQLLAWLDLKIEVTESKEYLPPEDATDYRIQLDKKKFELKQKRYIQVFSDKFEFFPNLSIIDLLMNEGPLARNYLLPKDRNIANYTDLKA